MEPQLNRTVVGLSRISTSSFRASRGVDGRHKVGHYDDNASWMTMRVDGQILQPRNFPRTALPQARRGSDPRSGRVRARKAMDRGTSTTISQPPLLLRPFDAAHRINPPAERDAARLDRAADSGMARRGAGTHLVRARPRVLAKSAGQRSAVAQRVPHTRCDAIDAVNRAPRIGREMPSSRAAARRPPSRPRPPGAGSCAI
jgi:hypothetical protein